MKKSLITLLALIFVLGIAATALAAGNPFMDVPTTSWAYKAIAQLASAGVIEGYGDGTFQGDKAMTRFEAAKMVAKAMAKEDTASADNKALIDKLAVEFATELNDLGVRVAKLEANASSIKITGEARLRYSAQYVPYTTTGSSATAPYGLTKGGDMDYFRLDMTSQVSDDTTFNSKVGTLTTYLGSNPTFYMFDMNLVTKDVFGSGATLTLGRQNVVMGPAQYFLNTNGMVDAAKATFAVDKGSLDVGYGDFSLINGSNSLTGLLSPGTGFDKAMWLNFKYPLNNATTFSAGYFDDVAGIGTVSNTNFEMKVTDVGFTSKLNSDFSLIGDYWVNAGNNKLATYIENAHPTAFVIRLAYKKVNPEVAGSWGSFVEYYNCQEGATASNSVSELQAGTIVNFQDDQKAIDLVAQMLSQKTLRSMQSKHLIPRIPLIILGY